MVQVSGCGRFKGLRFAHILFCTVAFLVVTPLRLSAAPPPNDDCTNAQVITGPGSFTGTTAEATSADLTCLGHATPDVWFSFSPMERTCVEFTTCSHGAAFDSILELRDGCSPDSTVLGCNDNFTPFCLFGWSYVAATLEAGKTYYVRVGAAAGVQVTGSFTLDMEFYTCSPVTPTPTPPPNDHCANPLEITDGVYEGSTELASHDGGSLCDFSPGGRDLWYRYTATSTGCLPIRVCADSALLTVSSHSGCPGTEANQISCGYWECEDFNLALDVVSGREYLIRVADPSAISFLMTIGPVIACTPFPTPDSTPVNDACTNAEEVPFFSSSRVYAELSDATKDGSASCDFDPAMRDVWYHIMPEMSGCVTIGENDFIFSPVFSVHTGCPGTTLNQIACVREDEVQFSSISVNVTAGQDYWVRVADLLRGPDPQEILAIDIFNCQPSPTPSPSFTPNIKGHLLGTSSATDGLDANGDESLDIADLIFQVLAD